MAPSSSPIKQPLHPSTAKEGTTEQGVLACEPGDLDETLENAEGSCDGLPPCLSSSGYRHESRDSCNQTTREKEEPMRDESEQLLSQGDVTCSAGNRLSALRKECLQEEEDNRESSDRMSFNRLPSACESQLNESLSSCCEQLSARGDHSGDALAEDGGSWHVEEEKRDVRRLADWIGEVGGNAAEDKETASEVKEIGIDHREIGIEVKETGAQFKQVDSKVEIVETESTEMDPQKQGHIPEAQQNLNESAEKERNTREEGSIPTHGMTKQENVELSCQPEELYTGGERVNDDSPCSDEILSIAEELSDGGSFKSAEAQIATASASPASEEIDLSTVNGLAMENDGPSMDNVVSVLGSPNENGLPMNQCASTDNVGLLMDDIDISVCQGEEKTREVPKNQQLPAEPATPAEPAEPAEPRECSELRRQVQECEDEKTKIEESEKSEFVEIRRKDLQRMNTLILELQTAKKILEERCVNAALAGTVTGHASRLFRGLAFGGRRDNESSSREQADRIAELEGRLEQSEGERDALLSHSSAAGTEIERQRGRHLQEVEHRKRLQALLSWLENDRHHLQRLADEETAALNSEIKELRAELRTRQETIESMLNKQEMPLPADPSRAGTPPEREQADGRRAELLKVLQKRTAEIGKLKEQLAEDKALVTMKDKQHEDERLQWRSQREEHIQQHAQQEERLQRQTQQLEQLNWSLCELRQEADKANVKQMQAKLEQITNHLEFLEEENASLRRQLNEVSQAAEMTFELQCALQELQLELHKKKNRSNSETECDDMGGSTGSTGKLSPVCITPLVSAGVGIPELAADSCDMASFADDEMGNIHQEMSDTRSPGDLDIPKKNAADERTKLNDFAGAGDSVLADEAAPLPVTGGKNQGEAQVGREMTADEQLQSLENEVADLRAQLVSQMRKSTRELSALRSVMKGEPISEQSFYPQPSELPDERVVFRADVSAVDWSSGTPPSKGNYHTESALLKEKDRIIEELMRRFVVSKSELEDIATPSPQGLASRLQSLWFNEPVSSGDLTLKELRMALHDTLMENMRLKSHLTALAAEFNSFLNAAHHSSDKQKEEG